MNASKRAILIVDDMAIFRESIEAALRGSGFETATAVNGKEALEALAKSLPNLMLLDISMPVMDGLQVLRHVRGDPKFSSLPILIMSAEVDRNHILEAMKLGISGYILKTNFSLKDVLQRVNSVIAGPPPRPGIPASKPPATPAPIQRAPSAAVTPPPAQAPPKPAPRSTPPSPEAAFEPAADLKSIKPIVTRTELLDLLKTCEELKGFSPTVTRVLKLTSSETTSLDAISKGIRQDQAMALKILKLANSSVYSRGDRVDTVHKAVLRIGMASIRQTVLNIGVVERFGSQAFGEHLSTPHFWEHSIACGIIGAEIAHALGDKEADSAFTSGLLHDLGRVIFAEVLGQRYIHVIETARRLQLPLELVESRMLLLNHADVMDRLLSAWRFPKHLVDPILHHHLSTGATRSVAPARVGEVLRLGLANRLAHAMLLGTSGNEAIYPTEEHCRAMGVTGAMIRVIEETARDQTNDTKFALLTTVSSAAWPRRSEQIREALTAPFRPLYVSLSPEIDAFRIFVSELASPQGDEPHNLAIVHIASGKEREALSEALLEAEKQAGGTKLPLLMLSPAAQWSLPERITRGRANMTIATPLVVSRLTAALSALLSDAPVQVAA